MVCVYRSMIRRIAFVRSLVYSRLEQLDASEQSDICGVR